MRRQLLRRAVLLPLLQLRREHRTTRLLPDLQLDRPRFGQRFGDANERLIRLDPAWVSRGSKQIYYLIFVEIIAPIKGKLLYYLSRRHRVLPRFAHARSRRNGWPNFTRARLDGDSELRRTSAL